MKVYELIGTRKILLYSNNHSFSRNVVNVALNKTLEKGIPNKVHKLGGEIRFPSQITNSLKETGYVSKCTLRRKGCYYG